jgi:ubiquitin-conjugating enzyme E2 J2
VSATEAERKTLASRTRWWNSTGGGSTKRTLSGQTDEAQARPSGGRGFGAIKAGDGGQRFKEHWPEEDEENWKWMESEKIDPQTGRSLVFQQQAQKQGAAAAAESPEASATNARRATAAAVPQGWLSKNKWYIIAAALFAYVLTARALGDQK